MKRHSFLFGLGRASRKGMVLLEVVIALAVFTLVAVSLMVALNAAFDAGKERNEIDAVTRGLENQRALLHATRVALADKDLPDDSSGILYHLTIKPERLQDQKKQPVLGIYRATITARWTSGRQAEDRSVTELIYQP